MEKFDARGTYYTAMGLMNRCDELGVQFSADDLHSLLQRGHELATQTFTHISCRSVSHLAFKEDVEKGKKAIEWLTGGNSINFAYPYGHVTLGAKKKLGTHLMSSRSIFKGLNGPMVDLNLLRANSLYGDLDQFTQAENLISRNVSKKAWLIFYTHDVRSFPSSYGCTPALFEAAVSCACKSGSRIMTVRKVLAELGVQSGHRKGRTHVQ